MNQTIVNLAQNASVFIWQRLLLFDYVIVEFSIPNNSVMSINEETKIFFIHGDTSQLENKLQETSSIEKRSIPWFDQGLSDSFHKLLTEKIIIYTLIVEIVEIFHLHILQNITSRSHSLKGHM